MDGNNSLKRVEGSGHADRRVFESCYLIKPEEVDQFENEVRGHTAAPPVHPIDADDHGDGAECTKRWKAANESAGGESSVRPFEQTGIFVCACRHGIVESFAEMRHSGELYAQHSSLPETLLKSCCSRAKYPLATVMRLLEVLGHSQGIGHDIACSFTSTINKSSIGIKARQLNLLLSVNAFHGHAHNRLCQLRFHPLYLEILGLEDLETCERIFSASNLVARTVRFASHFHWLQYIDLHFDQWDQDRYLELGSSLY